MGGRETKKPSFIHSFIHSSFRFSSGCYGLVSKKTEVTVSLQEAHGVVGWLGRDSKYDVKK